MLLITGPMNARKSPENGVIKVGLSGMTGFARVTGSDASGHWTWEARSVNGRGLDLRINLPNGYETLETELRRMAAESFSRGNLQINLRFSQAEAAQSVEVNKDVLAKLVAAYEAQTGTPVTGAALATLFTIKGVVNYEAAESDPETQRGRRTPALRETARQLFDSLRAARQNEGAKLLPLMQEHLTQIAQLHQGADALAASQTAMIRARFASQLADLDDAGHLNDERFAAEVAVLATKADVTEELDRLAAHVARGHELLSSAEPVGRDLGFLAQELNREANTLCSKSAFLDLTNMGLSLKSIIDQFREQAANVE